MKISKLFLFVLVCLLFETGYAQKTWEKPFQKWSKEETLKVLNNSPWAQNYQSSEALASADQDQIGRERSDQNLRRQTTLGSSGRTLAPAPVYIRLHSALPIRQAFVRLQQLEVGYDKFDEKKRAEFDAATKNILECPLCKNYYIVTITKAVNSSGQGVEEGLFQTMTLNELKSNVWLENEKGEKRELVQFTPPKGGKDLAIFFFERGKENTNFISPAEVKEFRFVFSNAFFSAKNPYSALLPRSFDFKVSKLLIGNSVEF
jgi:hypothetical protein